MRKTEFTTENQSLTIRLHEDDQTVFMTWIGKCTMLEPGQFLNPIFDEAVSYQKKIIINFHQLQFITSSAFNPIVKILDKMKHGTGEIEIQYDKNSEWQSMHFSALEIFCTPDKRVIVHGV